MSIKVNIYNQKAQPVKEIQLSEKIFGVKVNEALIHQAMVAQMGNERQVLAHTKDRSEVRGGGKKPWKQKGTGRARVGSRRSPIWIGGGVTFGPTKDRNFKKDINQKMKQKAMFMTLSDKVENEKLVVLENLELSGFKTKVVNEIVTGLEKAVFAKKEEAKKIKRSILLINDKKDEKVKYSGRNLAGVKVINLENINILDLLKYKNLVLTEDCVTKLQEKYSEVKKKVSKKGQEVK